MIASAAPLPAVLESLVRLIEGRAPGMLCSILLLHEDGRRLLHGAAPGLPESYNRAIDGLAIGPAAGSCGTAAYRKKPVIVSDVARDPLWSDYRALALEHGLRACWSTPIFSRGDEVLGTFACYYRTPRKPGKSRRELIRTATHLAGIAIERARTERLLHRHIKSLEAIHSLTTTISQSFDLQAILDGALEKALEILGCDAGRIFLIDPTSRSLHLAAHKGTGYDRTQLPPYEQGEGIVGRIAESGRPLVFEDIRGDPQYSSLSRRKSLRRAGFRAAAFVPIKAHQMILGVMDLASYSPRFFLPGQLELTTSIANEIGIAVRNLTLFQEAKTRSRELETLFKINRDVASILDLGALLPRMAEEARKILDTDFAYFRLLEGDHLVVRGFSGRDPLTLLPVKRSAACFAGTVVRENRPLVMHRPGDPSEPNENGRMLMQAGYHCFLGVPMRVRNRIIGTANLGSKRHRDFSAEEIKLMEAFADQAAIAIHNSQLYDAILKQAVKLAAANEETARANRQMQAHIAERQRLEKEVLEIIGRERQRIGQDLHDGLGQDLTGIAFLAKGLEEKLRRRSAAEATEAEKITRLVNETIRRARSIARGLSPVPVEADGLMSALEELAASIRSVFRVDCEFRCERPILVDDNGTATHLYRIAQEAAGNAIKHGKATEITIELSGSNGTGVLTVADNGAGISDSVEGDRGFGLRIMKHRAEMIQGSLEIGPQDRGGTIVRCSFTPGRPSEEENHGVDATGN